MDENKGNNPLTKAAVIIVLTCLVGFMLFKYDISEIAPENIKGWILSFGVLSPYIFILLYTLRPLVMFPASIFMVVGGLAFGVWHGFLYVYIGSITSAILAYFLARFLGRDFVVKILGDRMSKIDKLLMNEGFSVVFYMRMIMPYDPLSYVAGLCDISFRTYMLATMLAVIPGIFAHVYLGNAFSKLSSLNDLLRPEFMLSISMIVGVVLLSILIRIIAKRFEQHNERNPRSRATGE